LFQHAGLAVASCGVGWAAMSGISATTRSVGACWRSARHNKGDRTGRPAYGLRKVSGWTRPGAAAATGRRPLFMHANQAGQVRQALCWPVADEGGVVRCSNVSRRDFRPGMTPTLKMDD
jgi:hypothetical protein